MPAEKAATPKVTFEPNAQASARALTDKEIEDKLAKGAKISNTALSHHYAKRQAGYGTAAPSSRRTGRVDAAAALATLQGIQISDPGLDRSDESAIAINPQNPDNIVAGAATFDGAQFTNSVYVTIDAGAAWQTVTALTATDEC